MNIQGFEKLPLIGILRGITIEMVSPIVDVITNSGLKFIEVTMNTPEAVKIIEKFSKLSNKSFSIGAGTVTSEDELLLAIDSGASFIVMPSLVTDVVTSCKTKNIPVFPGALTPTEIFNAWSAGATMVKVFPSSVFGPKYFKEIKGPLDRVKLLACGGINEKTIGEYFKNGASGAAFGGSLFKKEWLSNGAFEQIEHKLKILIEAYKDWKNV